MASPLLLTNARKGDIIMAQGEWKTINGARVFIKDGQSVDDAFDKKGTGAKNGSIIVGKGQKSRFKIGLEFFSEKALENQTISQLEKGIRNKQKRIEIHRLKIKYPHTVYPNWDTFDDARKQREINHWTREIKTHLQEIKDRKELIAKRRKNEPFFHN